MLRHLRKVRGQRESSFSPLLVMDLHQDTLSVVSGPVTNLFQALVAYGTARYVKRGEADSEKFLSPQGR